MIAKGGTAKEAEKLATEFQTLLVGVVLEQREVEEGERHHPRPGAADEPSRRSRRTCRTSSRPTTTSAPAAASSCGA